MPRASPSKRSPPFGRADARNLLAIRPGGIALAALALAGYAATGLSAYWIFLATSAAISAIVIRSIGLITGQTGMISLCQLSFAALGAWTVGRLNLHGMPLPFPLAIVVAGLAAVPFGVVVGLPALRLRGVNLAVVTLGFAAVTDLYLATNGFPGADITEPVYLTGTFSNPRAYFVLCWTAFLVVAVTLGWLGRTRLGAAWLAVHQSERATAAMGISVPRIKLGAFAISAAVAGVAGGLLAGQLSILSTSQFQVLGSLATFAVAVMVGARFGEGAAIGGVLSAFFPEVLRRLSLPLDVADFVFAIGAIDVLRRGQGGLAERVRVAVRHRRWRMSTIDTRMTVKPEHPDAERTDPAKPGGPGKSVAGNAFALDVSGVTVRFGSVLALDGVDLRVPSGAVHALIGPNGAGKSTLVDAVTGFLRGYQGTITVNGVALDRFPVHRRARVGVRRTFQQDRTIAELTVGQYVRLVARRHLTDRELMELLAFLACPPPPTPIDVVDVSARRLVEVAGTIAARPAIVLLDEPAAGLAESESRLLATRIAQVPQRFGCSVLLIEHDMAHVRAASSMVTALHAGRVIASGTPAEVLAHREVVAGYLGGARGTPSGTP